jgi:hypothetical protein
MHVTTETTKLLLIHTGEFDTMGLAEVNVAWDNVSVEEHPKEIFSECFAMASFAFSYILESVSKSYWWYRNDHKR